MRRDVAAIEYRLRLGRKMLERYSSPDVKAVHLVGEKYPRGWAASPDQERRRLKEDTRRREAE